MLEGRLTKVRSVTLSTRSSKASINLSVILPFSLFSSFVVYFSYLHRHQPWLDPKPYPNQAVMQVLKHVQTLSPYLDTRASARLTASVMFMMSWMAQWPSLLQSKVR